jgi:hypothetical protein
MQQDVLNHVLNHRHNPKRCGLDATLDLVSTGSKQSFSR